MASTGTIANITGFTLIEATDEYEYYSFYQNFSYEGTYQNPIYENTHWDGWRKTLYRRTVSTRVYECNIADGVKAPPSSPINPGKLTPIFSISTASQQFTPWGGTYDDNWVDSWMCTGAEVTRDYGSPLSSRYRETWEKKGKWEAINTEEFKPNAKEE